MLRSGPARGARPAARARRRRPRRAAAAARTVRPRSRAGFRRASPPGTRLRPGASRLMISARPPNAASGRPPPTILPRMVRSGRDPEALLRSAAGDAEARDHLVEDQQRAGGVAERAQRLEEARLGRDDAHVPRDRLDEHGREPLAVALDSRGRGNDVVVRRDDRVGGHASGHARARRDAERGDARARIGQQRVDMAVVAAGELEDAIAARVARGRAGSRSSRPRCPKRRGAPSRPTGRRPRSPRRARLRPRSARRRSCPAARPRRPRRESPGPRGRRSAAPRT